MNRLVAHASAVALAMSSFSLCVAAEDGAQRRSWQSGVIRSETGYVDSESGARVESIEATEAGDYRVLVSLPRSARFTEIEEVRVTAPRIRDQKPLPATRFEFVKDYHHDRHGLYIYVGQYKDLPFRLYFKDHSAAEIQNTSH
ncbi:MAG: hypothetical protein R3221_05040 [Spongiibacter sp.]|nr:hypothetical protein [Spongiibacter sp.]